MSKFGWDLPPGCKVSDIPGNRPEDETQEAIEMGFYENPKDKFGKSRFTPTEWKYLGSKTRTKLLEDIIWKAIEYGIGVGIQQEKQGKEEDSFIGMSIDQLSKFFDET